METNEKILHKGHRQRMLKKVDCNETLYDHEILEIILYYICPRINTNPLAHTLLERFCSLSEVFKASVEELKNVDGVGENIARFIRTIGYCISRAGSIEGAAVLKTLGDCKNFVGMRMRGKSEEFLELYFLEKNGRVKRIISYTSADRNKVTANADEIISEISLAKPYGILVAHNHLNGSVTPSQKDENFTRQIQFICNMNNVKLWDHIIYSDGNYYSFNEDGKMEYISQKFSFGNAMKWINNTD